MVNIHTSGRPRLTLVVYPKIILKSRLKLTKVGALPCILLVSCIEMTTVQIRINKLRAQFLRKGIKVKTDWIEGCVDYFMSEEPRITDEALLSKAYGQWLLADLKEVGLPSLPASINNNPKRHSVTGKYALQVNFMLDISSSPYDQLRSLYNKQLDEVVEDRQPMTQVADAKK